MKMTGLEWRYLQKIALDHPYFDTHKLPLTEKEAKAIVEANNRMTGREFVDSIYAKLGMTRPQEEKRRFAWLRSIGELFTVPPIRKVAIAVLVAVLMAVFFAATPTGRAIAESVIHYTATLFENGIVVFNRNDTETMANPVYSIPDSGEEIQELESNNGYLNTFEEFTTTMDKQPVILPFPYKELYYDCDVTIDYLKLNAVYETSKGTITTYQTWGTEGLVSVTSTGFSAYDADSSIYYSIEEDGAITIMKLYEDSILGIYSTGSFTVDEIVSLLPDK